MIKNNCIRKSIILVMAFIFAVISNIDASLARGRYPLFKRDIPKAAWVAPYFKIIDSRAREACLMPLRSRIIGGENLELRVWEGNSANRLSGFVIKRQDGNWSAFYIPNTPIVKVRNKTKLQSVTPRSGWDSLINRLSGKGLLTLPDSTQIKGYRNNSDTTFYVFEIGQKNSYRTFMYNNLETQTFSEAKAILEMVNLLKAEFGVNTLR